VKRLSIVMVLPSYLLMSNTPVAAYELFTLLASPAEVRVRVGNRCGSYQCPSVFIWFL
jgi:hypothetical protein